MQVLLSWWKRSLKSPPPGGKKPSPHIIQFWSEYLECYCIWSSKHLFKFWTRDVLKLKFKVTSSQCHYVCIKKKLKKSELKDNVIVKQIFFLFLWILCVEMSWQPCFWGKTVCSDTKLNGVFQLTVLTIYHWNLWPCGKVAGLFYCLNCDF